MGVNTSPFPRNSLSNISPLFKFPDPINFYYPVREELSLPLPLCPISLIILFDIQKHPFPDRRSGDYYIRYSDDIP
jgi:hypothetical protein